MFCPYCGKSLRDDAKFCSGCGNALGTQQTENNSNPATTGLNQQMPAAPVNRSTTDRSRIVAGLLGVFFGGIGAHKFYMGHTFWGVMYLLFCWTFVPVILGFIEGIMYLLMNDESFAKRCL